VQLRGGLHDCLKPEIRFTLEKLSYILTIQQIQWFSNVFFLQSTFTSYKAKWACARCESVLPASKQVA
jgi:hypothetical protein